MEGEQAVRGNMGGAAGNGEAVLYPLIQDVVGLYSATEQRLQSSA